MGIWSIIGLVILGYLILCIIAYYVQEYFIFKPEKLPEDFEFKYEDDFEEHTYEPEPNVKINTLRFPVEHRRGVVIYFHGNTRSIKGWAKYARDFTQYRYEVIMVDYRGFGKSTGRRIEAAMYEDMEFIYNRIRNQFGYEESEIIIYGRSLGSGFATELARKPNSPKMLILDAPYYSFSHLTSRFLFFLPLSMLLKFNIRTDIYIRYVDCPIYIIHGTKDLLIPFRSSVRLRNLVPLRGRLVPIYGGGHNNLPDFPEYHQKLGEILNDRFDLVFDRHLGLD